jgi:hypothetical protein
MFFSDEETTALKTSIEGIKIAFSIVNDYSIDY